MRLFQRRQGLVYVTLEWRHSGREPVIGCESVMWLWRQSNHIADRFGKSTLISMISNSVTHLLLYQFRNCRYCRKPIPQSPPLPRQAQMSPHRALTSLHRVPISSHRVMSVWVFHVSECFKSVSWCLASGSRCFTMYHNVLHVFHDVLLCLCFMMFSESRNDRRRRIGYRTAPATTPQGLAITSQKLPMAPQGSSISPRTLSHAKLRPEWRLE